MPFARSRGSTGLAAASGPGMWPAAWRSAMAAGRSVPSSHAPMAGDAAPRTVAEGDVVLIVDAVGDVQVVVEVGRPGVDRADHRARLRGVELGVVAVQVQVARVGAPARLLRAALVDAREGGRPLVPVDVQDGDEQEVGPVEQVLAGAAHRHVAEQHQARVLAVDLARVDARLGEEGGLARRPQRLGSERALAGGDDHPDVAPLGTPAQRDELQLGRGGGQLPQPGHGVGVARSPPQPAALGGRRPRVRGGDHQLAARAVPGDLRRQDRHRAREGHCCSTDHAHRSS